MGYLIIICSMLLFSAIFSGLEIAFITSDSMIIEMHRKKSNNLIYNTLSKFTKKPSRFLATLLIGNNLSLVIYGIYMEEVLQSSLQDFTSNYLIILLIQTVISTIIILIFAEYLPKALFRVKPYKTLAFFAIPINIMYVGMKWVVSIFVNISKSILVAVFKLNFDEAPSIFGKIELGQYLENRTSDANEKDMETEVQIYKNVLEFSNVRIRECMIPRTEITALDVTTDMEVLANAFIETGLSKILIYRDSIDEIIGFVHHFELFKSPKSIRSILLPVGFIPSSMLAQEALNSFIKLKKSVLVVVDEFGGTAGMVTVEDVMEEIFGEIEDEHDTTEHTEIVLSENEFLFSGRLEIDYLNEKHNLSLPIGEEYETIAGYLFTHFESIPEAKEELKTDEYKYIVEEVSETRIELVRVISLLE